MPRPNEHEIDEFDACFLETLASYRFANFPQEKGLTRYKIQKILNSDKRTSMSHDKVLKCAKELHRLGFVTMLTRKRRTRRKREIRFDITVIGLVRWFSYLKQRHSFSDEKINMLMNRCGRLIPWIANYWTSLTEFYREKGLFEKLLDAAVNVHIDYSNNDVTSEANVKASLEIENLTCTISSYPLLNNSRIRERALLYENLNRDLEKILTFVFIHNLVMSNYTLDESKHIHVVKDAVKQLFSLVDSDPHVRTCYREYFSQMREHYTSAVGLLQKIAKNSLTN